MIRLQIALFTLLMATPAILPAQSSASGQVAGTRKELGDIFRSDRQSGKAVDYRSVIRHSDGTTTTITDDGDTHNVVGQGRTQQTVGRGITHEQVLATHYRPLQGDVLYFVQRLNSVGNPTTIYASPALKNELNVRASGNAYGLRMQEQARTQADADEARRRLAAQQQRQSERGHTDGGSRDREPPAHEWIHGEAKGGPVSFPD